MSSEEVMAYEANGGYPPSEIYHNDMDIKKILDQLVDGTFSHGDREMFREIYSSFLSPSYGRADQYFILKDFQSYAEAQARVNKAYQDKSRWAKMAILNTAKSGKFTSDRTIEEYVRDIWHLEKVQVEL